MTQRQQLIGVGIVIMIVAVLIGVRIFLNPSEAATPPASDDTIFTGLARRQTTDDAPLLGDPRAPITVVYFIDFACEHCADYWQTLQPFITESVQPGTTRLELRILAGLDPIGSPLAAQAALCAGEQDALWEMSDALFQMQRDFGRTAFATTRISNVAEVLRLDTTDLLTCLNDDERFSEALQNTATLAANLDIMTLPAVLLRQTGTSPNRPTWIMDGGNPLTGGIPLETLTATIADRLATDGDIP